MTNGNDSIFTSNKPSSTHNPSTGQIIPLANGDGLTKREYFAAMAMQGSQVPKDYIDRQRELDIRANPYNEMNKPTPRSRMQIEADYYVELADALIEALNKK